MFPAYIVPPQDITEVIFAVSELEDDCTESEISQFANVSERKVRESLKVLDELGIVVGEDRYTLEFPYSDQIQQLPPDERGAIIEEALLQHQPFIDYAHYLEQGYSSEQAAQKVFAGNRKRSKKFDYLQTYFERLGKYSGILTDEGDIEIEIREIPADSSESIEQLREALDSKLEIRIYLDNILGEKLMNFLDEDTKSDLVDAYLKHNQQPRDSISAAGRALEDFLRHIGSEYGSPDRDYSSASGIIPVVNHLQGDDLIRKIHKRRVFAFSEIRNKGGAHGDDAEVLERWNTSPEISLHAAMDATLLIRTIYLFVTEERLTL